MNHQPPKIVVHNVVSYVDINMEGVDSINLRALASKTEGSRYNPKRFPAVVIRKSKPKGTALIFRSGKIIIIGAQSELDSEVLGRKVVKDLSHVLGKKMKINSFRITNIVASANLGRKLDVGRLAEDQVAEHDRDEA